jgi:hypothetical protein
MRFIEAEMIHEDQNIVPAYVRLRRTLGGHLGWIWRMSRRTESKVRSRDVSWRTAQERPIVAFKSTLNSGPTPCLSHSFPFHTLSHIFRVRTYCIPNAAAAYLIVWKHRLLCGRLVQHFLFASSRRL